MVIQCKECGEILAQTIGKRGREFCDSTCRSNFWQKAKRKVDNLVEKKKPSGKRVDVEELNPEIPPIPKREDFKDNWDFVTAKNEWKRKYNQ